MRRVIEIWDDDLKELEDYKAKWNALEEMLGELELIPDDGTPTSTVDGFVEVWKKQKDEIKKLKDEMFFMRGRLDKCNEDEQCLKDALRFIADGEI